MGLWNRELRRKNRVLANRTNLNFSKQMLNNLIQREKQRNKQVNGIILPNNPTMFEIEQFAAQHNEVPEDEDQAFICHFWMNESTRNFELPSFRWEERR